MRRQAVGDRSLGYKQEADEGVSSRRMVAGHIAGVQLANNLS